MIQTSVIEAELAIVISAKLFQASLDCYKQKEFILKLDVKKEKTIEKAEMWLHFLKGKERALQEISDKRKEIYKEES